MPIFRFGLLLFAFVCPSLPAMAEDFSKPHIKVFKAKRELQLFDGEKLVKTYRIALGNNPVPPKEREGDMATPEGSLFHLPQKSAEQISPFPRRQLPGTRGCRARPESRFDFETGTRRNPSRGC